MLQAEEGVVDPKKKNWDISVCMNAQISAMKKAGNIKFGMKIAVYYMQIIGFSNIKYSNLRPR